MVMPAAAARTKPRILPRLLSVIGIVLIILGLAVFLLTFGTSFKGAATTGTHSFTLIGEETGARSDFPEELINLSRQDYEKDRANIITEARESGDKIGAGANDGWIWVKTKARLAQLDDLNDSDINVEVENGVVTLTGSVGSAAEKNHAEAATKTIEGVRQVVDKLTVTSATDARPKSDSERVAPIATPFRKVAARKREERTQIEVEWPKQMNLTDKGVVRVSILTDAQPLATPTAELPNSEALRFDPAHCNTPNAALRNAYGSQYEASAVAKLTSAAFNVTTDQAGPKSLVQSKITFTWNIEPKVSGSQPITLNVSAQWKHKRNNQLKPECEILNRSFPVNVQESIVSEGNLKKYGTIVALVGAFLQLPIFLGRKGGAKDKDDKDE